MQLTYLLCDSDSAQGCTYGAGVGAGAARRGGFAFTRKSKHKTVGPSRVKIRKFEGPRSIGTLTEMY